MRIGVFGGTFDPPHVGHLALARAAKVQLELDEVLVIPAFRNPTKATKSVASPKQRLEMVRLMIEGEPGFATSDMELTRGGASYTVETLSELQMVRPGDYWFLMGADALRGLTEWRSPERLARLCRLAVAMRLPMTEPEVRAKTPPAFQEVVDIVRMDPQEISSTDVRNRMSTGRPVKQLLHPAVMAYIREQKLYGLR
jgi:nicotinate-nucleotide adenylyltransferase